MYLYKITLYNSEYFRYICRTIPLSLENNIEIFLFLVMKIFFKNQCSTDTMLVGTQRIGNNILAPIEEYCESVKILNIRLLDFILRNKSHFFFSFYHVLKHILNSPCYKYHIENCEYVVLFDLNNL